MSNHLVNAAAEIRAVHTILRSTNSEVRTTCLGRLDTTYFAFKPTLVIFERLSELLQNVTSIPSLKVFLSDAAIVDDEQAQTILTADDIPPVDTPEDLEHLIHQLDQARQFRALSNASLGINKQLAKKEAKVEVITGLVEQALLEVRSNADQRVTIYHSGSQNTTDDVVRDILDTSTAGSVVSSGFNNFDSRTGGGYRRGDLIVVASHYKGGKSIFKLNSLFVQYMYHNLNVCDVTLEMSVEEETQRLLSRTSGVEFATIYNHKNQPMSREDQTRVERAWAAHVEHGKKNNCRFSIFPAASVNPAQLELMLKPFKYDVIAIDYVNLFAPDNPTKGGQVDAQQLSTWFKQLKRMAKSLNCVVIALTQLDKQTENIRYSRAALEDANNVLAWTYGEAQQAHHVLKIRQLAARSSTPFTFFLRENFAHMEVTDHDGDFFDDEESVASEEPFKGNKPWKKS